MQNFYVYMLTNKTNKVLYTGVTNNLERRILEHRSGMVPGFTRKCKVTKLVYYENCFDVKAAIAREKQIKGWLREKKNSLVATLNPEWNDLASAMLSPLSS